MKITRLLTGLLIIAAGPAVTVYLFMLGKGGGAEVFPLIVGVLIMSGVTGAVSAAAHLLFKDPVPATAISVLISEVLYVLLLLAYICCMSTGRGRAESFMWLPIMIPFLVLFGLPTAFSVSYGTGMIVMGFGEGTSNRSEDFARSLIEDEEKQASQKKRAELPSK